MQNQILKGVNLSQDKTIKDHNTLIIRGIDELINFMNLSEEVDITEFNINLSIVKRTYEQLELKLLK